MGGAFIAIASDISATYYNPAGLAFQETPSLSLSANIYSYMYYVRESDMAGMPKIEFQRFNPVSTTFAVNFKPLKSLALGVTLFYQFVQAKFMSFSDDGGGTTYVSQNQVESGGIVPRVGFKWDITESFKTGITFSAETIHTNGKNTYADSATSQQGTVDGDIRLPHRLSAGIAYEEKGSFAVALDFIYYFEMEYDAPHEMIRTDSPNNVHHEVQHFDVSLGGEVFLTDGLALRLGFFTNTSDASDNFASERVLMLGGTFGIGFISDNISSGISASFANGQSDFQQSTGETESVKWKRIETSLIIGSTIQF